MPEVRTVTYVSFANPRQCLGVLILDGELGVLDAAMKAHQLGLNPGGEVIACSCKETDEDVPPEIFEAMWNNRNRLIPGTEARVLFDGASIKDLSGDEVQN